MQTQLMTREEAAEYLRIKKSTLDAWACKGGGPVFIKMGRACRYRISDLEAFLSENTRRNTSKETLKPDKNMDYLRLIEGIFGSVGDLKNVNISIGEIEKAIEGLDTRERFVLRGRYSGKTLKELGPLIMNTSQQHPDTGVSTETVRQIEAKAMRKLRYVFRHVTL